MTEDDFKFYQTLLLTRSGMHLPAEKTYLLETRLTPIGKTLGHDTLPAYTDFLRRHGRACDHDAVIEAMTTNETSFFRDIKPFQHLRQDLLPLFFARRAEQKKLRLWSAAASTGQEAYSIAIILAELAQARPGWHFDILGTDISETVLHKARSGAYNNFEIQRGLSMPTIIRHFRQHDSNWIIRDELRAMVDFKKFNLLDNPARVGLFDIVFCRNVLIYFTPEAKLRVLKSLYNALPEDGVLFLGSCENIMGDRSGFTALPAIHGAYVKKTAAALFAPAPAQTASL